MVDIRRLFRWPKTNAGGGGAGADGVWWPSYPNANTDTVAHFASYPPKAMRLPAVRRAVSVISTDLARLPVKIYAYVGDSWEDLGRTTECVALNEQASEYHTASEFKRWTFSQCLLWGNSFALISRRGTELDKFIPLNAADCSLNRASDGTYYYTTSEYGEVAPADVLHFRMPSFVRQLWGDSPVVDAARAMALNGELETTGLESYRMPGLGKLSITTEESIGADGVRQMQDAFKSAHSGPDGMLRPIIAQNGASVAQVGQSLVDQDWIQARKQAIEDIARVYGIPPYVLFSEAGTAYTAEQARMYADSLATYTDAWQSELTSKLYPGQDVKVCFDTTQLMRGSFGESMSAYKEAIQLGVMTPNEVRMELGLTPMEGGDQMYVGPNMQPGGTTDGTGVPPTDGADDIEPDDG
jgi:HK97 family phage portal protein